MDYIEQLLHRIESLDKEICTNDEIDDRCAVCHGTGFEEIKEPVDLYGGGLASFMKPCSACNGGHIQKVREGKISANIPEERDLSSFDWNMYNGYNLNREQKIVNKFTSEFQDFEAEGMGLFITSKTRGSGKTFLASCIGGELLNRYEAKTIFVNASDLLDISQKRTDPAEDPIDRLISCRILILDDLGQKLTGKDWMTDILFRIIDKRYQQKKIVIVTSNDPLRELNFDDRIVDRLNSMTITIKLPEECVRAREANTRKQAILKKLGIE